MASVTTDLQLPLVLHWLCVTDLVYDQVKIMHNQKYHKISKNCNVYYIET